MPNNKNSTLAIKQERVGNPQSFMQKLISVMLALTALGQAPRTEAQTFLGNNQPGGGSSFGFSLAAGITNIS